MCKHGKRQGGADGRSVPRRLESETHASEGLEVAAVETPGSPDVRSWDQASQKRTPPDTRRQPATQGLTPVPNVDILLIVSRQST